MQDPDWSDLRVVLALARFGTLAEAARRLRVDPTTVSRRVVRAEAALGARLFDRVEGNWRPTAAGVRAAAAAERMEGEAGGLAEAVAGADAAVAGTVRLTSVPILVDHVLIPALPGLLARHPDLAVELIAEPRSLSLTRREADLALRLARPTGEQSALARRIGRLAYAAYAPAGADPSVLPWIGYDDSMADLPPARRTAALAARDGETLAGLRVNDGGGLLQAVRAGIGKGVLPRMVGDAAPGLVRLDDPEAEFDRELWLLTHPELRGLARVKAVAGWLESALRGETPFHQSSSRTDALPRGRSGTHWAAGEVGPGSRPG